MMSRLTIKKLNSYTNYLIQDTFCHCDHNHGLYSKVMFSNRTKKARADYSELRQTIVDANMLHLTSGLFDDEDCQTIGCNCDNEAELEYDETSCAPGV